MEFRRTNPVRNRNRNRNFYTDNPTGWYCTVCRLDMHILSKIPHLNGKPHAKRVGELGLPPQARVAVSPPKTTARVEAGREKEEREGGGEKAEEEGVGGLKVEDEEKGEDEDEEGEGEKEGEGEDHEVEVNERENTEEGLPANEGQLIDLDDTHHDWPEIPSQTLSSMLWRCTTCDETLSIFFRDEHLAGRAHAKMLRRKTQPQNSEATPEPIIPSSMTWQCTLCNETMNLFHKYEHLTGKRHTKTLQAQGPPQDPDISRDFPEFAASTYWKPDEYDIYANEANDGFNDVEISSPPQIAKNHFDHDTLDGEAFDLGAFEHIAQYIPQTTVSVNSHGLDPEPEHQVKEDVEAPIDWSVTPVLNQVWDSAAAKWTCMTCSVTVEMSGKEAHLASAGHMARCNCSVCTQYKLISSQGSQRVDTNHGEQVLTEKQLSKIEAEPKIEIRDSAPGDCTGEQADISLNEQTEIFSGETSPKKEGMFNCRICEADFVLEYRWMHLSKAWECKVCNKWLHIDWKDRHLERHTKKAQKPSESHDTATDKSTTAVLTPDRLEMPSATPSPSIEEQFYCPVCKKDLTLDHKKPHQGSTWQCTACKLTVHILGEGQDIVCKKKSWEIHDEPQSQKDLVAGGEQDIESDGTIDLLGDEIDISTQGFRRIPQQVNRSFIDDYDQDLMLMLDESTATTNLEEAHPPNAQGPESKSKNQSKSTTEYTSAIQQSLDHEPTLEGQNHFLQQVEGAEDAQPSSKQAKIPPEASSPIAKPENEPQNTNEPAPTTGGPTNYEPTEGSQNHPLQHMEEIGDAQSSSGQVETPPKAPSSIVPETLHCTICGDRNYPIENKKFHTGRAWECTICEKTMHRGSRDSHLDGAKHKARELLRARAGIIAIAPPTPVTPTPRAIWMTAAVPAMAATPTRIVPETPPDTPTPTEPETFYCELCRKVLRIKHKKLHQSREWECTICNVRIHTAWKYGHMAGRKHIKKYENQGGMVLPEEAGSNSSISA